MFALVLRASIRCSFDIKADTFVRPSSKHASPEMDRRGFTLQVSLPCFNLYKYNVAPKAKRKCIHFLESSPFLSPPNLKALPVLSLFPRNYAISIMKKANNGRWNNSDPRSVDWEDTLCKSVPAEIYGWYERTEAAHKNGMKNWPVFLGAVLAENIVNLSPSTMNTFVGAYLVSRVAYTYAYINISSHRLTLIRSAIWAAGTLLCMGMYTHASITML
jgi:uncharacterized MAPEG superfamily protein